jgi:molecular chaperone GrpE
MSQDRPHSRSGPGATTGAWAGASGLGPNDVPVDGVALPGEGAASAAPLPGDALPMEPGKEYVDKLDHARVVEQLTRERDEMKDSLQRMAADYENFKRRSALQRQQASAAAETQLLGELLVVIDDMERAAAHADQNVGASHPKVAEGVRMVQQRIEGIVTGHGLERIEAIGTFDPSLHEAMMVQPTDGVEEGQIVQVLQSGWKLGDRVLRHARVIVAG